MIGFRLAIARVLAAWLLASGIAHGSPSVATGPDARLEVLRRAERSARPPSAEKVAAELGEIGALYLEAGEGGRAIEILEEAVARNPDADRPLALLVLAYVRGDGFDFAASYLDVASQRPPPQRLDPAFYAEIGDRFAAANRLDSAVLAWDLFRRAGGSDASVSKRLDRARRELSATSGQRSLASEHFTIFADEAISVDELRDIDHRLSAEYQRQARLFGSDLDSPQVVILHAGRRYFSLVSIPDWVSGVFDGKIRISMDAGRPASELGRDLEPVLVHELAHAFIRDVSRGRAPGWLHEGLAQWCSGRRIPRGDFVRELGRARPKTLAEMEGNLAIPFDLESARANYAEALGLIEFLADVRGEGAVYCIVRDLGTGQDVAAALRREAGSSPPELVASWKSWAGL